MISLKNDVPYCHVLIHKPDISGYLGDVSPYHPWFQVEVAIPWGTHMGFMGWNVLMFPACALRHVGSRMLCIHRNPQDDGKVKSYTDIVMIHLSITFLSFWGPFFISIKGLPARHTQFRSRPVARFWSPLSVLWSGGGLNVRFLNVTHCHYRAARGIMN